MGLAECRCGSDATRGVPLPIRCDPHMRPAHATRRVSLRVAGYSAAANIWWRIFDDLAFGREGLTDAVVQPVLRDRLGRGLVLDLAMAGKLCEDRESDRLGVHVEEPARSRPGVGKPKAIGAE